MDGIFFVDGITTLAAAILIAGAAIGSGLGIGQIGAKLIEGSARQPMEAYK